MTADYLDIRTPIVVSSAVDIDHGLRGEQKVVALCRALEATRYVNLTGGRALYSPAAFTDHGIELRFIQSRPIAYRQFDAPFMPSLSILDVMMFNSRDVVRDMVVAYDLVS